MRRSSIFVAILVTIAVSASIGLLPVFADVAGPTNPKGNGTTAYDLLHPNGTISTLPPISITTDLQNYNQGDAIVITGHIRELQNGTGLVFKVINPLKNLVQVGQLAPKKDGSFTTSIKATGPLWKQAGNYSIIANYGTYNQVNATFHYNGGNGDTSVTQSINSTYPLQAGNQIYNIPYIIKGATVKSMDVLAPKFTLEITLNPATAPGSITVSLPRDFIDAKVLPPINADSNLTGVKVNQKQLEDASFIVVVGDKAVTQFSEIKNPNTRTLSIPFNTGDTKVDIVGTIIVPEFGPIAALVFAIAIISIVAVSAKTGLRFTPKY